MSNLILDTDSYKPSHYLQYPPRTRNLFNYLESRGGEYKKTVFFGLQYLLEEYLSRPISALDVDEAAEFFKAHGVPFNDQGWRGIVWDHNGFIPLKIRALPEGTVTPTSIPLLTCEATDPKYFWVVGWFETMIMRIWYPITVATLSYHVKQDIKKYLNETADDLSGLPFKLHDFGSRGVSSRESAAIGGASHLVNFQGSDTVVGVHLANKYYNAGMAGFSIPAAEHSTITSWGKEFEVEAFDNMLNKFAKPGSILAVVSDSYDIFNAAENLWGFDLRQKVIDSGATVVIRPDSGDPIITVNKLLHILDNKFGSKVNSKGFRVLNHVRVIQGDGLSPYVIERLMASAKLAGFSVDNLAFGMGGGLLQHVNRDTLRFAYKCSAIERAAPLEYGEATYWFDVYKQPVDDPGKISKKGLLGTKLEEGKFQVTHRDDPANLLEPVFETGKILRRQTFADIRKRAE